MALRTSILLVACAACAATPAPPAAPAPGALVMSGTVLRAAPDPELDLTVYDAEQLFHLAGELDRNDRLDRAIAAYARLLSEFPGDALAHPGRFNLGLLYERKRDWANAARAYEPLTTPPPPEEPEARRTWLHAHYRLAVCLGKLGEDWWRVVGLFDRVLAQDDLTDYDRLEAMVGRGIALQSAGDAEGAELQFMHALRFFREANERARFEDHGLAAEAAFRMGDIGRVKYEAVQLAFPVDLLAERLEQKCEALLAAQSRYLRAMQLGDAHTVAAAGYRIGTLYESLYDHILALEVPTELDAEQAEVYRDEVKNRIRILVEKAIQVYEKSLLVGRRVETAGDWVQRIESALARLKAIYLTDTGDATSQKT